MTKDFTKQISFYLIIIGSSPKNDLSDWYYTFLSHFRLCNENASTTNQILILSQSKTSNVESKYY